MCPVRGSPDCTWPPQEAVMCGVDCRSLARRSLASCNRPRTTIPGKCGLIKRECGTNGFAGASPLRWPFPRAVWTSTNGELRVRALLRRFPLPGLANPRPRHRGIPPCRSPRGPRCRLCTPPSHWLAPSVRRAQRGAYGSGWRGEGSPALLHRSGSGRSSRPLHICLRRAGAPMTRAARTCSPGPPCCRGGGLFRCCCYCCSRHRM